MNSAPEESPDAAPIRSDAMGETVRQSRELLEVVREASDEGLQDELTVLAMVLDQLVDLLEFWQQANPPAADEARALAAFIDRAVELLRSTLSADASLSADGGHSADGGPLPPVEQFTREAVDRWGEFLSLTDLAAVEARGDHSWSGTDPWNDANAWSDADRAWNAGSAADGVEGDSDSNAAAEPDVDAPSQQEISELLAQLVSSGGPTVAGSPEAAPLQTDPLQAAPPPADPPAAGTQATVPANAAAVGAAAVEMDAEIREAFLDDAGRCLSGIEEAVLAFEAQPDNRSPLQQICRELHTLKGAAGSVGLAELANDLHHFEDSLRDSQQATAALPSVDELFARFDAIRQQIEAVSAGGAAPAASPQSSSPQSSLPQSSLPQSSLMQPPPSAAARTSSPSPGVPSPLASASAASGTPASFTDASADDETVRVKSSQLNRLMDMLAELVMLRNRRDSELNELKGIHRELLDSVSRLRAIGDRGAVADLQRSEQPETVAGVHPSPRMTEVASDILETAQRLRDCYQPVADGNQAVSQFIRQFRQELVELRRMPVSGLFRRLQRVASDAARAEKKQVRLQLIGEDAGIERAMQERLYEPLLHIIRNAVSHGIEEPEDRLRHGKDAFGVVTLEALTSSDLLVLEIRDDGRGLNYDALRRRGIEKGLLDPAMAATREELAQLIFHPGFSTQQAASQISGRGVGMDVVAAAIARMRGWIEIDSTPGHGTTFRLTFPLPSVIQHTMVFRAGGQIFALPMQFVQAAGSTAENVRALPFADLFGAAESADAGAAPTQMLVLASPAAPASSSGAADALPWVLLVDEILGPEEVVVRPLPSLLKHHPLCSGATLSGMGEVVLVLDKRRLMELIVRQEMPRAASGLRGTDAAAGSREELPRVLVVDDSLSARKRLVQSLNRYQLEIIEASDGAEASELLKSTAFAAVFSDWEMPRQSGIELLAEIRQGTAHPELPMVIVSSRGEESFQRRAQELGVDAYLLKPLTDAALDDALAGLPISFAARK